MKKRILSLVCCLAIMVPGVQLQSAFAAEPTDVEKANLDQLNVMDIVNRENPLTDTAMIQAYTNTIQNLSDVEFDKMIAEMMENTTDVVELTDTLATYGVTFGMSETPTVSPMYLDDRDVNFTNYYAKRGGDSYYRLFTKLTFDDQELHPASLDGLVTYFNPDLSKYYGYDILSEDAFTLRSERAKGDGYITFNFHDEVIRGIGYKDAYTVVIYVIPLVSGQYIEYGAELGHSYADEDFSVSGSISIELPKSFGGDIGFEVSRSERYWQRASGDSEFIDR